MSSDSSAKRRAALVLVMTLAAGCTSYGTVEQVPLADDLITLRDRFFDVATVDGERVVVVGYGGKILLSEDGGGRWRRVESPTDKSLLRVEFADTENGWSVGQDGVVVRSRDGGATWEALSSGVESHLFGLAVRSRESVFACGDRSRWVETRDGGATWSSATVPISPVGMNRDIELAVAEPIYYDAAFVDETTGWIVGDYGNIRFTTDGGRSWGSQHESLLGQSLPGYMRPLRDALDLPALFRIAFRGRDRGWVSGVGGLVLETDDGGRRWRVVDPGVSPRVSAPLLDIAFAGDRPLVFGGSAVVLGADPAGGWRRIDPGLPLLTWFAGAEFAVSGERAGRRGFVVGGLGSILRTDDGGEHWTPVGRTREPTA